MSSAPRPRTTGYDDDDVVASRRYETVPADVVVDLAHSVIGVLRAENETLRSENQRLRNELEQTTALLRPRDAVLQ